MDFYSLLNLPLPSGLYASADLTDEYKLEYFGQTISRYDGEVTPARFQIVNNNDKLISRFVSMPDDFSHFGGEKQFNRAVNSIARELTIVLSRREERLKKKLKDSERLRKLICR